MNEVILNLFNEFHQAVKNLKRLSSLSKEEFLSDIDKVDSAKYNFVKAIEAMIDICNHIISQERWETAEEYADIFRIMTQHGIFSLDFLSILIEMVRFRNLLVHLYWKISNERVYKALKENLKDFKIFEENVQRFLRKQEYEK